MKDRLMEPGRTLLPGNGAAHRTGQWKVLFFTLLLGVAMITPIPLIATVQSARAAAAVYLNAGESTTFPTWAFGRHTRLCAQASGGNATVRVNAGGSEESFSVSDGQTECISRNWGGIIIGVTNQRSSTVQVWTS